MKNGIVLMIAIFVTFASGLFLGRHTVPGNGGSGGSDTVYITKTVTRDNPLPSSVSYGGYVSIPRVLFVESPERTDTLSVVDTVDVHDTTVVYVPKEHKYYNLEDGELQIWASGYGVNIDRYQFERKTEIIRRKDRFNLSASGGYGIGKDGLTPIIGVTLGVTLFSF